MLQRNEVIAVFSGPAGPESTTDEVLRVPQWLRGDWETLLAYASPMEVSAGHVLIQKDEAARTLFLVAGGVLEVTAILGGHSLASIAKIKPGSVVGEIAFLDGNPRSAKVWAVQDADLCRLEYEDYERFASDHPALACQFVFGVARLVALRLRRAFTARR
jgi:CRP-like cAMP-binding protein